MVPRGGAFDCIDARVLAAMGAFKTRVLVEGSAAVRDNRRPRTELADGSDCDQCRKKPSGTTTGQRSICFASAQLACLILLHIYTCHHDITNLPHVSQRITGVPAPWSSMEASEIALGGSQLQQLWILDHQAYLVAWSQLALPLCVMHYGTTAACKQ